MAEVNKEELRRLAEAMPELDWDSQFEAFEQTGFCSVYAPPFEIDGELMDGHTYVELCHRHEAQFIAGAKEAVLSLLDENAAQAARIAELERECERLRERLEISSQCPYDGIATRDITIEVLEREIDRFKEANQRLSEESVRRRSELEARWKDIEQLRLQVEQMVPSPLLGQKVIEPYAVPKCGVCGGYHNGLGNLPCPKCTPVAQAAMQEGGA